MRTIKNVHLIEPFLSDEELEKLVHGAKLHKRHARIEFKVKSVDSEKVVIRTTQGKSPAENYAHKKELIDLTRHLFGKSINGREIIVHATPYQEPPPEIVTPEWIQGQMTRKGVKLVDLVKDTGIHKSTLSTLVNGNRPMSQPVKAMFYYYFK